MERSKLCHYIPKLARYVFLFFTCAGKMSACEAKNNKQIIWELVESGHHDFGTSRVLMSSIL